MDFLALFFICVRMFHFIHAQRIFYFLQNFSRMLQQRRSHPERKQVILIDASASILLVYFTMDALFLLYCIWLMLKEATWTPGFLLLVIAAMETLAIKARIDGTYTTDKDGYVYPSSWFRYLTFGESMFILLKLFEG